MNTISQGYFIVLLAGSPVLLFCIHVVLSRLVLSLKMRIPAPVVLIAAILAGLLVTLLLCWTVYLQKLSISADFWWGGFYAVLVYGCLSYAYLHLYLMAETARRLHILYELSHHGVLSQEELARRYGAKDMLLMRLNRLLAMRQLCRKDSRYFLDGRFFYVLSKIIMAWGNLLGFYSSALK